MSPDQFLDEDRCDVPCVLTLRDGTRAKVWVDGVGGGVQLRLTGWTDGCRVAHPVVDVLDVEILSIS